MGARLIVFFFLMVLAACTTPKDASKPEPPEVLHRQGLEALRGKRFLTASKRFQEVDRKYPFSTMATKAQVNLIYAHFKREEYAEAISAAERFIRLHPSHRHAPYAFYMRGMAHYKQISSAYQDQGRTREAITALQEVISRYPESDYAWEAERMLVLCRDRLAQQETVVARYYLDRGEYIAAIKRFNEVVKNPQYAATPYVEEALFSLVLASQRLGLKEEARNYAAVLGHNFPDRAFYKRARALLEKGQDVYRWEMADLRQGVQESSSVSRIFKGLVPAMVPNQ